MTLSLACVQYFLVLVVGFGKGKEMRARCFPLPFFFLHTARKSSLTCQHPQGYTDCSLLFPNYLNNPKFSPNKRETKNKASEIPLLQSRDQPGLIVCNVWRQMTFKTSILPKGQYRESQFPIMLCRLPMIQTCLRQSALF